MSRAQPRLSLRLPILSIALCLLCGVAAAGAPDADRTATRDALARLSSPLLAVRRRAVRRLVTLLPGSRAQVVAALPDAPWVAQLHLIEVLSRDRSPEAVDALLRHLVRADETQAQRIRVSLARDEAARDRLLAAWRADPKAFDRSVGTSALGQRRLRDLLALLRRAEIEARFLSRKSASGSTGYYKGQYEHLEGKDRRPGYRDLALQVVTGIALDEAMPTPGVYRTGVYRFLQAHHVDEFELRSMALNAVAELCTPDDERVIERLERNRIRLARKRLTLEERLADLDQRGVDRRSKEYEDVLADYDDSVGDYLDQVECLYLIVPERYEKKIEDVVRDVETDYNLLRRWSLIAGLYIRVGWYEKAVDAYQVMMVRGYGSAALGYYNQACAYASWSTKAGLGHRDREERLDFAISCLEQSVYSGWSDVRWMNEDRDLDPLRAHRKLRYDALVAKIRKDLELPPPK